MSGAPAEEEGKAVKQRTWWHPLLASVLRWQMESRYQVKDEVPVGQMPLRLDIVLIDRQQGELTDLARKMLAGLLEYVNDMTMLELKGPSDSLSPGDAHAFLIHALLLRQQHDPMLDPGKLSLILLAPAITEPFKKELAVLKITPKNVARGVWQLEGNTFGHSTWLLETGELAGAEHPVLTVVSARILEDPQGTYELLQEAGCGALFVYVARQIQQFQRLGREFSMTHLGAEDELKEVVRGFLPYLSVEDRLLGLSPEERVKGLPPEERVKGLPPEERVKGLPPEERVKGLPPEERVKGLPPEERVKGLPPEEILGALSSEQLAKLRELLQRSTGPDNSASSSQE